jgi:hypothetical protein
MEEGIFIDIKSRLDEFTDIIYIDYERESVLLEVHKDYLDEIVKIVKNNWLNLEIIFQKELKSDILTMVIAMQVFIDEIIE